MVGEGGNNTTQHNTHERTNVLMPSEVTGLQIGESYALVQLVVEEKYKSNNRKKIKDKSYMQIRHTFDHQHHHYTCKLTLDIHDTNTQTHTHTYDTVGLTR